MPRRDAAAVVVGALGGLETDPERRVLGPGDEPGPGPFLAGGAPGAV